MSARSLSVATSRKQVALSGQPDALTAREVDGLVSKLLTEVKIPFPSLGKRVLGHLADLKKVLSADYLEEADLPDKHLLKELSRVVDSDIKNEMASWYQAGKKPWEAPEILPVITKLFGGRDLELRAEPYLEGAGLALRGFFCRANVGAKSKFVIFLNTAHHPGAVVATFGHEIGHYIYGSLVGERAPMAAFLEGTFSNHLHEEDELFADSLVAFSAYSHDLIKEIGPLKNVIPGKSDELFGRIRRAYGLVGTRYELDLTERKMGNVWRVRYLTSMVHFFKLRCALLEKAGL
jgi:hypothetical protein